MIRNLPRARRAAIVVLALGTSTLLATGCRTEKGPLEKRVDQLMAIDLPINISLARANAKACQGGKDPRACAELGWAVEQGMREAPDIEVDDPCFVHDLFQQACEADDPKGCYALGRHYMAGSCVEPDKARGRALFEKSCLADFRVACAFFDTTGR